MKTEYLITIKMKTNKVSFVDKLNQLVLAVAIILCVPSVGWSANRNIDKAEAGTSPSGKPIARLHGATSKPQAPAKKLPHVAHSKGIVPPPPPGAVPRGLVPPPPPLPIGGQLNLYTSPQYSYQSADQLKQTLADLQGQLKQAQKDLDQTSSEARDSIDRAKSFDDLYKEGVVSRRELEQAKRDADESQTRISQAENQVKFIQQDISQVEEAMKSYLKTKKKK
jgi:hypothetical protein